MRVDVFFTVAHAEPALLQEATVVVIDAVRATTSMVEALANGPGDLSHGLYRGSREAGGVAGTG